jgi:hypothetical protein
MRTDESDRPLSVRLEPVKRGAVDALLLARRCWLVGSVVVMLGMIGLRTTSAAMVSFGMWTKLVYTFAIAVFGFWLVERAGRPGAEMTTAAWLWLACRCWPCPAGGLQNERPAGRHAALVMGRSSRVCAYLVT